MDEHEDDSITLAIEDTGGFSLRRLCRFASNRMAVWREQKYARSAGQRALALFQRLHKEQPELTGEALFEVFVCQRNELHGSAAKMILRRAEESFAAWPNERDLIFRDVVQYLVISEYLVSYPKRTGTTTNMVGIISKVISKDL
jgi:hypothetical protein